MLNKKDGAAVDFDAPPAKKRKLSCNKAKIFKNASFIVDTDLESSSLSTKKNIITTENNVNRKDEELNIKDVQEELEHVTNSPHVKSLDTKVVKTFNDSEYDESNGGSSNHNLNYSVTRCF